MENKTIYIFRVFINILMVSALDGLDSCQNLNHIDLFYPENNVCAREDVKNGHIHEPKLATSMNEWHLDEKQILYETFPIDKERRNFVREVRNVLFSSVEPTVLKSKVRMAAVSTKVLQDILNMDAKRIATDDKFLQVCRPRASYVLHE